MRTRSKVTAAALCAALAAGGAAAVCRAQDRPEGEAPPAAEDYGALVKRLGDADFAGREKAYERLRSAGAAAREALAGGAETGDEQVRWSCRRLLRLLDDPAAKGRAGALEFREDDGDEAAPGAAPGPLTFGLDDEAFRRAMDEIRRRMADLEKQFRDGNHGGAWKSRPRSQPLRPGVERHVTVDRDGEKTSLDQSADGKVKVTLGRKAEDGSLKDEVIEAPSLEALQKEHPEAYAKVKDLLGDRIEVRVLTPGLKMPEFRLPDHGWQGWRLVDPGPSWPDYRGLREAKPVLGVTLSEVPAVLRTQLSMKADEGMVVESVLPDSPAARLGLQTHDVLLAVNGVPVSTAEDVRSAVTAVKEGGALHVRVLRAGKPAELDGVR